jgi:hypothetical protein
MSEHFVGYAVSMPAGTYIRTPDILAKMSSSHIQEFVGYSGMHDRLNDQRGQPSICTECLRSDNGTRYEWALMVATDFDEPRQLWYSMDPENYTRLCRFCHMQLDLSTGQNERNRLAAARYRARRKAAAA